MTVLKGIVGNLTSGFTNLSQAPPPKKNTPGFFVRNGLQHTRGPEIIPKTAKKAATQKQDRRAIMPGWISGPNNRPHPQFFCQKRFATHRGPEGPNTAPNTAKHSQRQTNDFRAKRCTSTVSAWKGCSDGPIWPGDRSRGLQDPPKTNSGISSQTPAKNLLAGNAWH